MVEKSYDAVPQQELTQLSGVNPTITTQKKTVSRVPTYDRANVFSRFTFWWMNAILSLGRRHRLQEDDLTLPDQDEAEVCYNLFWDNWTKEQTKKKPSLLRALIISFWDELLIAGLYKLCWGGLMITAAYYFVKNIVEYVRYGELDSYTDDEDWDYRGWVLAVFFFVDCFLMSVSLQQMASHGARMGIRVRGAVMTAVYRKALKIDGISSQVGDVVTLVSADCSRLHEGCTNIHYLWSGPLESATMVGLLFGTVGDSAAFGVGVIVLALPLQYFIAYMITYTRVANIEAQDKRVQVMHEILHAIKLVKFYAWEKPFVRTVRQIRATELRMLARVAIYKSINLVLVYIMPPLIVLGIFSIYVKEQKELLVSSVAFVVLSLMNSLRFPLVVLPVSIKNASDTLNALARIQTFLMNPEVHQPDVDSADPRIEMKDCVLYYPRVEDVPILSGISFELKPGQVLAVVGPVGGGKTTFLNGLLGESTLKSGHMIANGKRAFVPQTPWIQQCSVRDNVLFGKPMDEDRYQKALFACALEKDLDILEYGDLTEIGEGGINLSGGQKQRIALARAVYADADIYLLDTPLSAVDSYTCNHIMEHCIKGLLKHKIVVLVMHQLQLLPQMDKVLVVQDGKVLYSGEYYPELIPTYFPTAIVTVEKARARSESTEEKPARPRAKSQHLNDHKPKMSFEMRRIQEWDDSMKKKSVWDTNPYLLWMKHANYVYASIALALVVGTQVVRINSDVFIREWTLDQPKDPKNAAQVAEVMDNQNYYILVYGLYVLGFFIALLIRGLVFFFDNLKAATLMHNRMLKAVLQAPLSFFTVTPLGALLNSFSKEQDQVDETLADATHVMCIYVMQVLTAISVVIAIIPLFAIVAGVLVVSFVALHFYYSDTANFIKHMIAHSNPGIYSHVSESVSGIAVIRAFAREDFFMKENIYRINRNHRAIFNMEQLQCWVAFRLDTMASLMVLATALFCVGMLKGKDDGPAAGLAISNILQTIVFLTMLVRSYTDMRSQISSVESITHWVESPSERQGKEVDIPQHWPEDGKIEFQDVGLRYFQESPLVLRHVSFTVWPGEKVGIIGRTGSGKSTLLMALFRLVELAYGTLKIDGVDISKLHLTALRRHLAIIPQQPVMFKGTIRSNLDPFGQYSDERLWQALERSHLKDFIARLPLKLESPVTENGENMSLGHQQLVCLARAILNDSKILVLDEATSALDLETDALIQETVRTVFASKTIMTIAHRLETLQDYDKILYMADGYVVEFDRRETLLANPNSHYYKLVHGISDPNPAGEAKAQHGLGRSSASTHAALPEPDTSYATAV